MLRAQDIMSSHVLKIERDTPIHEAATIMDAHDVGSILVVENGITIGIATETDFTRKAVANDLESTTPVERIMSKPMHSCSPEADLMEVAHTMRSNHIKKLPVISGDQLHGIVTQTDVIRHIISTVQGLAHQYDKGKLSGDQYAQQAAALFHTFNKSLEDVTKNWHMRCEECGMRFLAEEKEGKLSVTSCPHCDSAHITYDQNPDI